MKLDSEPQILNGIEKGDPAAIAEIYKLFSRQLLFFARRITNGTEVAEDIVADIFLKIIRQPEKFESLEKLKAVLFRMVKNKAIDWLRAEKRHSLSHEQIRYLYPDSANDIERLIIKSEVLQILHNEIYKLPSKLRDVLLLSFLEGKSLHEISNEMNLAYKTVLNIKTRAVQQLRSRLLRQEGLQSSLSLCLLFFLPENI